MAHGNNRAARMPRFSARAAGGSVYLFRHPYLSGQIGGSGMIDEIDVSKSLRLNDTFFDAQPAQDSSIMEYLVDGSVITITNHILAGTATLQVLPTTGLVGDGDFIEALLLIIASKDTSGGLLTQIKTVNEKRIVTMFWGVTSKNVPHAREAGNAVIPYPVVLNYGGWARGVSSSASLMKTIWAVGNKTGISAQYKPYEVHKGDLGDDFFGGRPINEGDIGDARHLDDPTGDVNYDNPAGSANGAPGIAAVFE